MHLTHLNRASLFCLLLLSIPAQSRFNYTPSQAGVTQTDGSSSGSKRKLDHAALKNRLWGKTYTEMTYEELAEAIKPIIARKDWKTAAKYYGQLRKVCDKPDENLAISLDLADALFQNGDYAEAEKLYQTFVLICPRNKQTEFASYRAIQASFHATTAPTRDQTKTEETIELADQFLQNQTFATYRSDVVTIRNQCYEKLFVSGASICHSYLLYHRPTSAQKRFSHLQKMVDAEPFLQGAMAEFEKVYREEGGMFPARTETVLAENLTPNTSAEPGTMPSETPPTASSRSFTTRF